MLIPAYIIEELQKEEQRKRESGQEELTIQRSSIVPPDVAPATGNDIGVEELDFFI